MPKRFWDSLDIVKLLAIAFVALFAYQVILGHVPVDETLKSIIALIVGYYYGSSTGSKSKESLLTPPPVQPVGTSKFATSGEVAGSASVAVDGKTAPPAASSVAGSAAAFLVAACIGLMLLGGSAHAQAQRGGLNLPVDPLHLNDKSRGLGGPSGNASSDVEQIWQKIQAANLADLKFAKNIADKQGNTLTSNCWGAWITLIENDQKANLDKDGNALPEPDPHLITTVERMIDINNSLKPDSAFGMACAPLAQKVKLDLLGLISKVAAGTFSAGLIPF